MMGKFTEQPSADNVQGKQNHVLGNMSVIFGVLGFVLPYLTFVVMGSLLNEFLIDKVGLQNFNLLNVYIPMILAIAGPIAIGVGFLSLQKHESGYVPGFWKNKAKIGIVLGVLVIPCVLFPLLLWLQLVKACAHGC